LFVLLCFKLQRLPVSFCQLKELRWLDLKNNPLVPTLAEAAGDCLDQKGCQDAAKKVVKLMTVVHTELQKKRNKAQEEIQRQLPLSSILPFRLFLFYIIPLGMFLTGLPNMNSKVDSQEFFA